jgi:hypothetical protein
MESNVTQQLRSIADDMREMRKSLVEYNRSSQENALKLERVLTQMEHLNRMGQDFQVFNTRVAENDLRIKLLEDDEAKGQPCVNEKHEDRIRKLENGQWRVSFVVAAAAGVMEVLFHVLSIWTKNR